MSSKFHLFAFDVNQRNKETGWNCHWNCMYLFGDCSWEVQMRKNGGTIKAGNSL